MISSQKILSALHANWWLNLAGLLLSFGASIVLVRAMPPGLYAEYGAVIAMIGVATLVFEAGANSGLTRYLAEAGQLEARGTFYRQMLKRRWLAAGACCLALFAAGPSYARAAHFDSLAARPWLFLMIAGAVAGTLMRLLAHYGLLALFESKTALLLQQGFLVLRSVLLAVIALSGCALWVLVYALLAVSVVEAAVVHGRLSRIIGRERAPLPEGFVNRAQGFGLLTIFDKACAMLGSGTVLLLVLAPHHPATMIAFLTLAIDLTGKITSLTVMPMGNLVAPYLSQTGDAPAAQALAIGRVVKLSSLLYCFCIGAGMLIIPAFVPLIYGARYTGAIACALALLVPAAFEAWVRGCCSPALLRNGHYRLLATLNVLQAAATVTALVLVRDRDVITVILTVGGTRALVAGLTLAATRRLLDSGGYRIPAQALALAIGAGLLSWQAGRFLPLPPPAVATLQAAFFAGLFLLGVGFVLRWDEDTLRIIRRVTGRGARGTADGPMQATAPIQ